MRLAAFTASIVLLLGPTQHLTTAEAGRVDSRGRNAIRQHRPQGAVESPGGSLGGIGGTTGAVATTAVDADDAGRPQQLRRAKSHKKKKKHKKDKKDTEGTAPEEEVSFELLPPGNLLDSAEPEENAEVPDEGVPKEMIDPEIELENYMEEEEEEIEEEEDRRR